MTMGKFLWSVFTFLNLSLFIFLNGMVLTGADTQQIMNEGNPYLAIPLLVIVSLVVSFSRYPR